jgi:hypothetical protein
MVLVVSAGFERKSHDGGFSEPRDLVNDPDENLQTHD